MPKLTTLFAAAVLSLLCSGYVGAGPTRAESRMPVRAYGFSVDVPAGWRAGAGPGGLPILVNFPWSQMQAQLRLPKGGAVVNFVAWDSLLRRKGDDSLAGWSQLDAVNAVPQTLTSERLDTPSSTEISDALMVTFDEATFGPLDQAQHQINVYWTFLGRKFASHLSYIVGDPKAVEYVDVLKHLVSSVRPL
jgi:hypothetical protein